MIFGRKSNRGGTSLAALRASASEIVSACRDARAAYAAPIASKRMTQVLDSAADEVSAIAARATDGLERLRKRRVSAGQYFRVLQTTYGTLRTPSKPDILETMTVIVPFWMLESVLAGGVMIAGGKVDVAAGLIYGTIFALVSIILGCLIGFMGLRYLNYRQPLDVFEREG